MEASDELRARVASFPRWHYEFDLGGVRTPIFDPDHVNRHAQRREYFFAPLVRLCGGSLQGRRVLDLGCNAGFWSLAAIEAGADFVLGLDGRQMHVDQARLVFEAKGVDPSRYRFELADVFAAELDEPPFDVVLCLGLLYHVSKPFELMERIERWGSDLVVIDTALSTARGPYFRFAAQDLDEPRSAVDRAVALHPTSEAVARLAQEFGFRCLMLRPRFTSWQGSSSYRDGRRRAFIAAKRTSLDGLDAEPVGTNVRPAAPPPGLAQRARRWARGRLPGAAGGR
jgi:SAM-dependent methyltransferase